MLIIKLSAMGDALCLMPTVRMLSEAFPESQIDWLTTDRSAPALFEELPFLNTVHRMPTQALPLGYFLVKLAGRLHRYDLVVDFDQYYRVSELVSYFGRCNAGFRAPLKGRSFAIREVYDPHRNEKLQFRALAESIINVWKRRIPGFRPQLPEIVNGFEPSPRLLDAVEIVKHEGRPILVLYPGSGGNASFRRWDFANYLALARNFSGRCAVVMAGGPDERNLKPQIIGISSVVHDWIDRWSLKEWAWFFFHHTDLFVGNDGGLYHLADSQGIPTVGIFGPALGRKWGSINPKSTTVEIDVECRPCLKNYLGLVPHNCARGDNACLRGIPLNLAIDVIEKHLLSSAPHPPTARAS